MPGTRERFVNARGRRSRRLPMKSGRGFNKAFLGSSLASSKTPTTLCASCDGRVGWLDQFTLMQMAAGFCLEWAGWVVRELGD